MQKVEEISGEGAKNLKNFQTNIVKHMKSCYTFKKILESVLWLKITNKPQNELYVQKRNA